MSTIQTEDGITLKEGDRAFNYYDMKPGVIGRIGNDGWFDFVQNASTPLLNGERICSMEFAAKKGWVK